MLEFKIHLFQLSLLIFFSALPAFSARPFEPLDQYAFEAVHRTDAVFILKDGKTLHERYARDTKPEAPHPLWSISKSVTQALVGAAIAEGKLKLTDSLCALLRQPLPASHCSITAQSLLQMSSGLRWQETYEHEPPTRSSVMQMLYGEGRASMASFVLGHPVASAPGSSWNYSSGDSLLLMRLLQSVYPAADYERLPWSRLFERLGIRSAVWERDQAGTFIASSALFMSARDLARFGQLYLADGVWGGSRILPQGWVNLAKKPPDSFFKPEHLSGEAIGAAQFWVNLALLSPHGRKPWPDAPADAFAALGHWGQSLWILPGENTVIVRLADDREELFDSNVFLKLALEGLRKTR